MWVDTKTILLADDDEAIQLCLEEIADQEGWTLTSARDGEECLRLASEVTPSLIILDQRMPKLTGIEVVRALEARRSTIPIIMISAERDLTLFSGHSSVIQVFKKPFDLGQFVSAVGDALGKV